ncbi:acetyl-CoA synthetase-like protein [Backusella circina FSU 941]|nr:acetyl-CoA synthetase-like protein [Backusella circina FSU 941]
MSPSLIPVLATGLGALFGSMYLDSKLLLSRDLDQIGYVLKSLIRVRLWQRKDRAHMYYRFKDIAKETPDKIFIVFEGKDYSFRQMERDSNRLAHWLLAKGVKRTDIVCMMHQNHPTFFTMYFAISKIGAVPSLINTNLSEGSLFHCIKIADTQHFLFDPLYANQVETIAQSCQEMNINMIAYGEANELQDIPDLSFARSLNPSELAGYSEEDTPEEYLSGIQATDPACLIYTSGTTGMPKAAISQHFRLSIAMGSFSHLSRMKPNDRIYNVLPLYHSSGLTVASFSIMYGGGTIVLGRKFSVTRFWDDCVKYDVDGFVYIGEFCRYLLSQPERPAEKLNKVRLAWGNGMRPDVWGRFKERFNIDTVMEFYAATEAPGSLFNTNTGELGMGSVGTRGRLVRFLQKNIELIMIDPISEEPLRGEDGFCVKCPYGEQGEFIVKLVEDAPINFAGYWKNEAATQKKILRDVFEKGDSYFRSGDLLKMDADGFYYFGDRIGDTFRWKSENVATTEVAEAFGHYPGIQEANIYGASVPNHDGRAGMAAIVLDEGFQLDFKDLAGFLRTRLPRYAIPLFLRFVPNMNMTGTFKQQKVAFRNQGIDLEKIPEGEQIFWLQDDTYVPFTTDDYAKIFNGKVKL